MPEIPPIIEPPPPPLKPVVPKPIISSTPITKVEELGPHQILTAMAESPETTELAPLKKPDAIADVDMDGNKEVLALSKIRAIVDDCIKKLANESGYSDIILELTRGEIATQAQALGWFLSDNVNMMEYDFPGEFDFKNKEDLRNFLRSMAGNFRVSSNKDFAQGNKYITLAYVRPLSDPDFYISPHNTYIEKIVYDPSDIKLLAKENCLMLLEEWSHVLQHESGSFLSKKYIGNLFSDSTLDLDMPEWDVAAYFVENGVNISGTRFERLYGRRNQNFQESDEQSK